MLFYLKLALSITVIIVCTQIGKRFSTLGGADCYNALNGINCPHLALFRQPHKL